MKWVYHFLITTVDGRSCTYSAFDESETAAELRIKTRYGVPVDAKFQVQQKDPDRRRRGERRED